MKQEDGIETDVRSVMLKGKIGSWTETGPVLLAVKASI